MASMSDSSSSEKLPVGGTFRRALLGPDLALSAELALQRRSKAIDVRQQAELFAPRVHAMQVPDNPLAWVHMSPLAAASLLTVSAPGMLTMSVIGDDAPSGVVG